MGITITDRIRFARALHSRPFALLWGGQTISTLGNGAFSTALAWEVLLLTGSATAMGVVVVAQTIPMLLFLLIGGVAADSLPRRLLMLWSDTGRAVIVLLIAGLGWVHLLQLWHLIVLAFCFGFVKCFFDPAYQAIRPQLVDVEAFSSANVLTGLSRQIGSLLGPLLGVGCVALAGPAGAFAFDGLTFVISALCLLMMRLPSVALPQLAITSDNLRKPRELLNTRKVVKDVFEGLSYVTRSKWLWVSMLAASVGNIGFAGSIGVALPKLVRDVYGAGIGLLGVITMASAAGSIIAPLLIGQMHHLRRRGVLAYLALIIYSIALAAFGLPLPRAYEAIVAVIANALVGFGLAAFDIIWVTVMQELVPNNKLGRVSSIDSLVSFIFMPIGYMVGGLLTDRIGPSWVFITGGALNLLVVVIGLSIRDIRQLE
jgi:MFS family permease